MKLLEVRLRWASWYTDQKPMKFTALEDMALEDKTSRKRWASLPPGTSSREAMWPYWGLRSRDKTKALNSFIIPRYFSSENKYI